LHLDAAQVELVAKEINLLLSLLAALSFAKLASRFKREKLALYIIIFFILLPYVAHYTFGITSVCHRKINKDRLHRPLDCSVKLIGY